MCELSVIENLPKRRCKCIPGSLLAGKQRIASKRRHLKRTEHRTVRGFVKKTKVGMPPATKNTSPIVCLFYHVGHLRMRVFTRGIRIHHRVAEDFGQQAVLAGIKKLILNHQHKVCIESAPKCLCQISRDRLFEINAGEFRAYRSGKRGDLHHR